MEFGKKMYLKCWLSVKILYGPDPKLIGNGGNFLTQYCRFQMESDSNTIKITGVEELFFLKTLEANTLVQNQWDIILD